MAVFNINALRFEDVRATVVNYLKENGKYKAEFDFDGDNIGYQIDIVAYNTMMLSYQNAQKSNNIFIDTTEIRKNAISIVKNMGYRPKRKLSSRFTGTMEYIASDGDAFQAGDTITIPARTLFTSAPNGHTFQNIVAITLTFQNTLLLSGSFVVYEGTFLNTTHFGTGLEVQTITVDSFDVEENNLSVSLRTSNTDSSNNVKWDFAPSFFSTTEDKIYFVEESVIEEKKPKIIFGDGTLGQIPLTTETITIEYLKSQGDVANNETTVVFNTDPNVVVNKVDALTWIADYTVDNLSIVIPELLKSYGGKDNETLESIKFNAPRFYSAGGRGVTDDDFITLLSVFESTMKYFNVTGGPELFPNNIQTEKGNIYFAGVPANIDESDFINNSKIYLYEIEEDEIIPKVKVNTVVSTIKKFVKPTYIYMEMAPIIEIPSSFSLNEINNTVTNSDTAINLHRDNNLVGLEKPYRHSKAVSSLSNTIGVSAAEIELDTYFIVNYDSFYSARVSRMNLPIVFQKDSNGLISLDENNNPLTTNYIKKRSDIITKENETASPAYTQETLPISKSSIYGNIFHKDSDRELYNIDITSIEFITFEMVGTIGSKKLNFQTFDFTDANDITYVANLTEITIESPIIGSQWWIQINGRNIGKLVQDDSDEELFTITNEDTSYLTDTVGVVSAPNESNLLNVDKIIETDENDVTTTFFSLNLLLSNETFSDVRLDGYNKFADATFDAATFQWTWTNTRTFYENNSAVPLSVSLGSYDPEALDENFLQVNHVDTTSDIILSMKHFNGTFSLNNFMRDAMVQYVHRNDLNLVKNYSTAQDASGHSYQLSNFNARDSLFVQRLTLNAYETTMITTIGNTGSPIGILDGTWFYLYSALDANPYYVWFNSTGSTPDPLAYSPATGIEITILDGWSAGQVATALQTELDSSSWLDFTATVGSGSTEDEVTIVNTTLGQTTNTSDGDTSGEETGFTFATLIPGSTNVIADINNMSAGDLVRVQTNDTTDNNGYFLIKTVNATSGWVDIYNYNGLTDISGNGSVTHYKITGTYGSYTIYGYDIYHGISIGTLNYTSGVVTFKQSIKGYTDLAALETQVRDIRDVFNNYNITIDGITTKMDKVLIAPVDNTTSNNVFLGPTRDFDAQFNQSIQTKIELPVVKK